MDSKNKLNKNQTWNNSYLLNIPLIDKQHMKFFKLFDMLLDLNRDVDKYFQIYEVIEELEKYTHEHFNTEEELMLKANAPEYESHLLQHQIFIKKVEDFKSAYSQKKPILLEQMIVFMRKWFLMHIAEVDGKYVEAVHNYLVEKALEED
jgi:hemerythrin